MTLKYKSSSNIINIEYNMHLLCINSVPKYIHVYIGIQSSNLRMRKKSKAEKVLRLF